MDMRNPSAFQFVTARQYHCAYFDVYRPGNGATEPESNMCEKAKWCVCFAGHSIHLCDIVCAGSSSGLLKRMAMGFQRD